MNNTALQRFPWGSIFLMLVAYMSFGHFLAETTNPRISLGIGITVAFVLAIAFLHPLTYLGRMIQRRFQSDAVAFCSLVLFAAFISILLNWFKLFLPIFMILSCEALTRIDFTHGRFCEKHACFWMTLTSWLGLAIGWAIGIWELHGFSWILPMLGIEF
jgi:hypothetical protein